jgi:hypothetical protein
MVAVDANAKAVSATLADGVVAALPGWVRRCVRDVMVAWCGEVPPDVAERAADAGQRAAAEVGGALRALLAADMDDQRTTPLSLVRAAVVYPTEVLAGAGAPPASRDRFAERAFPADVYDLSPASWADLDPSLVDAGIAWGATKAWDHRRRHLPAGSAQQPPLQTPPAAGSAQQPPHLLDPPAAGSNQERRHFQAPPGEGPPGGDGS